MIQYPEGLPLPLREGYGFNPLSPMKSTPLVTGKKIRRRAFESVPTRTTVTWLLSSSEAQVFEGWFQHILISGTLAFECPLKTPLGLENHQANFDDIYSGPELVGVDHWRYTAELWLLKRPVIDAEWLLIAPGYVLYSGLFDITINRVWPDA